MKPGFFLVVLSGVLSISCLTQAAAGPFIKCTSEVETEKKINKKEKLKTFTTDFWKVVRSRSANYPASLKSQGIIIGDFHFSNLGVYFDPSMDRARLVLNDLDDSGNGYLVGDLLKYLLFLNSLKKKVDWEQVIEAYSMGLQKKAVPMPFEIKLLLSMKAPDFDKEMIKYVQKRKIEAEQFDMDSITDEQRKTLGDIERLPLFKNLSSLQKWIQVNTTGSSAGMNRFSYVATSKFSGIEGAFEFKELRCSATGALDRQNLQENYDRVAGYLNKLNQVQTKNSFLNRQQIVYVSDKFFLLREKVPNYFKDLEAESLSGKKLQKFSEFFASYLGFVHSGSASQEYSDSIAANKDWLREEMKALYKEFKSSIENEDQ